MQRPSAAGLVRQPARTRSRERAAAARRFHWGHDGPNRLRASVGELPALRGFTVEWAEPGFFLLSRRNRLYRSEALRPPWTPLGEFPAPFWKSAIARLRPAQRALRFMCYNVLLLPDDEIFVTFGRDVGVFRGGVFHRLDGLRRPCRVLRSACALDDRGDVYFGEYIDNPERGEILVYRYTTGNDRVEVVHRFAPGAVRHVHGIYFDPFERSLWCLTGDWEHECGILKTSDGFRTLEPVGRGDETWRAVSILFTEGHVYYGMDAEFRTNHVFRLDRATGERTDLGEIDGPVYYSAAVGSDLFFAVTAELCPSQKGRSATLWHVSEGSELSPVTSFEKDAWDRRLFMHGMLHFPRGPGLNGSLLFHAVGLKSADNRTFRVTM